MSHESASPPDGMIALSTQVRRDSARSVAEAHLLLDHLETLFATLHRQLRVLTDLEGAAHLLATAPPADPALPAPLVSGHAAKP